MQLTPSLASPWKLAVSCFSHRRPSGLPGQSPGQISVQTCRQLLVTQPRSLLLVDVRNPNEYAREALPGSILVPFPEFQSGAGLIVIQHLLQDHPGRQLIVLCTAGVRSAKALALLQQAGISGWNLQGGLNAWKQAFGPLPQYGSRHVEEPNREKGLWAVN